MEHDEAVERLDEWLDGELAADDAAALSRHLDGCEACRKEAALRKRLGEALFAPLPAEHPAANEAFVARVMARVGESRVPAWRSWLGRSLAPALGLGLAALWLGIGRPFEPLEDWGAPEPPPVAFVEVP